MPRPGLDEYFLEIAFVVGKRATCLRNKVGTVIVRDKKILTTGYNGAPRGLKHCLDVGCIRVQQNIPSGTMHERCISGDTVIKLLNGEYKTIAELTEIGTDFWVYGIDLKTESIVPVLAKNPRITKYVDDMIEVTLDNNKTVKCTPDHKFLLRNGEYKEAQNLQNGDSLMPMYYNFSSYNHESISNTIVARKEKWKNGWIGKTPQTPTHILVYKYFYNNIESNCHIHHINCNERDNSPNNLRMITKEEHTRLHNKLNPIPRDKLIEYSKLGNKALKEKMKNDIEFRRMISELGKKNMSKNWENPKFREMMEIRRYEICSKGAHATNSVPEHIKLRMIGKILKGISELSFKSNKKLNSNNYEEVRKRYPTRKKLGETGNPAPSTDTILKYFKSIDEAINESKTYNHKVISINKISCNNEPVYDITVDETENFAVDLGDNSCIFLHNCRGTHSEQNAIIQAALHGITTEGATLYCTHQPCILCTKMIINAGIVRVVYTNGYPDPDSLSFFEEAGVIVERKEKFQE
jgi:deoxycytidylate deaminase